jgi:hypothetical protein
MWRCPRTLLIKDFYFPQERKVVLTSAGVESVCLSLMLRAAYPQKAENISIILEKSNYFFPQ